MSTTSRREASAASQRMGSDRRGGPRRTAPVDLSRPAPLGPDETRAVRSVHDELAARLSPMLTTRLRAPFRISVAAMEMVAGTDLTGAVADPSVIAVLDLESLPDPVVLRIPLPAASVMVDLLLGGAGEPDQSAAPPSSVELRLFQRLLEHCLGSFDEVWRPYVSVTTSLRALTCDAEVVEDLPLADPFLRIDLMLTVERAAYRADLWLPNSDLTAALRSVAPALARSSAAVPRATVRAKLTAALADIPVDVQVTFPEISMTPAEILNLRRGDVLVLGSADAPLRLHVGGTDVGTVRPARNGDRTACVLLSTITDPPSSGSAATSGAS